MAAAVRFGVLAACLPAAGTILYLDGLSERMWPKKAANGADAAKATEGVVRETMVAIAATSHFSAQNAPLGGTSTWGSGALGTLQLGGGGAAQSGSTAELGAGHGGMIVASARRGAGLSGAATGRGGSPHRDGYGPSRAGLQPRCVRPSTRRKQARSRRRRHRCRCRSHTRLGHR